MSNGVNKKLEVKKDDRGKLIEVFKIPGFGQVLYSTSKPGVLRGNHYHTRKEEKFFVIEGKAKITLRNRETGEIKEFFVDGGSPEIIDIPKNWVHNIKNTGQGELKLLVWANEVYNPDDPDTFAEEV